PDVRLARARLLDVDGSLRTAGALARRHVRRLVARRLRLEHLAEVFRPPDLPGGDVWLDARRSAERLSAEDDHLAIGALLELERPVIERDAPLRMARGIEQVLAQAKRDVDQRIGIVVHEDDGVALAHLVPEAVRRVHGNGPPQRIGHRAADVRRVHEAAELPHVGLEDTERALAALRAVAALAPRPAVPDDVDGIDVARVLTAVLRDDLRQDRMHQVV